MKTLKNLVGVTLPSIGVLFIILEVFFRTVIPATDPPRNFFHDKEKMYSFSNKKEKGLNTIGRFAEIRARWRINNMSWNYPIDYDPQIDKKLIAVIGDSFIEALQVDVWKIYPYLLREKLKDEYEVYAFGKSEAPLSQYLHMSRYVNKHFNPDILIINLVHNDFDESLQELYPQRNYFLQVSVDEHGSISETVPRPNLSSRQYKPWKRLIFGSALFRYVHVNLKFSHSLYRLSATRKNYEANVDTETVEKNREIIFRSTNHLIKTIWEENADKRVIFVMDAPRSALYNNTVDQSGVRWMHEMVETICNDYKIEFIDLTRFMKEDFGIHGVKFNSDLDHHLNEYGHEFVADILYEYLKKAE